MNFHIIPLHQYEDLSEKASPYDITSKMEVAGVKIFGDSLSDPGGKNGMYDKKILGCIPLSLFLYKSPHEQFTNGFGWDYAFYKELAYLRKTQNPLENPNLVPIHGFFKSVNRAQGGAMAYNYGKILSLFKYLKGFFLSLILTNIQNEAKKLKKSIKFDSDDLAIIFAGANDLVTAGYCNKGGAERAIRGIAKTIDILTTSQQKAENYAKNILAFTLPDFSKTPRFSKKTEKEKKQAKEACHSFNEGLRDLAKNYQYFDFSLCGVYQVDKKEDVKLSNIKEKGIIIIITGSGSTRKVYFVDKKQFILRDGKEISVDIKLSKDEKKLLSKEKGQVLRNGSTIGLEKLIHNLSRKAKLNADIKIFDAAAVFEKIDENPEAYGFTSGCAVYYLDKNQDKECVSKNITSGNAIIIKEINQAYNSQNELAVEFCCYYVKDGKLVEHAINTTRIASTTSLTLTMGEKIELQKKLKQYPLVNGISQLIGMEDKHASWTTHIVQSAIQAHENKFGEKIYLADIYASVLLATKKHFPNEQDIFWDDLHPSVIVHFLLETMFEPFFKNNYNVKQPRIWMDDMAINERVSPQIELPPKSAEASDGYSLRRTF